MNIIHYIPIVTTVFCAWFFTHLWKHWQSKKGARYLLWWTIGVACYGAGTLVESSVTLFGWSPFLFKSWYITGALLGGIPLAQGTVHLLMNPRFARLSERLVVAVIIICSLLVILSPLRLELAEPRRLSGSVLEWQWIRWTTPFINLYAFVFLVGGAIYSAFRYRGNPEFKGRFQGNVLIAIGGLLPGIGGSFTKAGYTEVLYVTELIGILFIYLGYSVIRKDRSLSVHTAQV